MDVRNAVKRAATLTAALVLGLFIASLQVAACAGSYTLIQDHGLIVQGVGVFLFVSCLTGLLGYLLYKAVFRNSYICSFLFCGLAFIIVLGKFADLAFISVGWPTLTEAPPGETVTLTDTIITLAIAFYVAVVMYIRGLHCVTHERHAA